MFEWTFWFLLKRVFFFGSLELVELLRVKERCGFADKIAAGERGFVLMLRNTWLHPFVSMINNICDSI